MNALLLSALALVSANDFVELPIFRKSTNVNIKTSGGWNGVAFKRESLYANITINSDLYETHLEPERGDLWIFEDEFNQTARPHAPFEGDPQRLGFKKDLGMYNTDPVEYGDIYLFLPYAVLNRALAVDSSRIAGLGLGPSHSPTFDYPIASEHTRWEYGNLADSLKDGWAQSDAFTINLAADPSKEDKLVYGAMDLSRFTGKLKALQRSASTYLINAEFTINGMKSTASLDIEDPNTYLEDEVVAAIAKKLGAEWDDTYKLYAISAKPQDGLVLNFDGLEIKVPSDDLWVQDKRVGEKWYFTVRPYTSSSQWPRDATLGADILRSAYIVYDLGHKRAAIGQAVRNPGPPEYEVIPAEGIPERFLI